MGDRKIQKGKDGRTSAPAEVARTLRSRLTMQARPSTQLPPEKKKPESGPVPSSRSKIGTAPTQPPPPLDLTEPGPRYVFMNEIGRGGMGRVDEVFDGMLGRSIAQKCALPEGGEGYATMLVSEAQTCAQLEHPAIVPVYDVGVGPDGAPYYTMRRVRGRTLYDVLRDIDKPLSQSQLLAVLRQVCLAVDYAHSRGVVHRDLKPENVIVGEFGEVYVLDWGIAELLEGSDVKRTRKEKFSAGSPGYMAPEQITGAPVTARTDVFALGVMLYEGLSGLRLFQDEDHASLVSRATGDLAPVVIVPPGVLGSSHLEALVRTCIEVNPDRRPGSSRFIADAIDDHLDGERARVEREKEADALVLEAAATYDTFVALEKESKRLMEDAEEELAAIAPWESVETKQPAWDKQAKARRIASEAARTLARAETAFLRALGRVEDHEEARAGMAWLHFKQFEEAERQGDAERMAQQLDLARVYDDGPLSLELSNIGALVVSCSHPEAKLELAKYETRGWLLELGTPRPLGIGEMVHIEAGSWVVTARLGDKQMRAPVLVGRAAKHELRLELGALKTLPKGMILIPGGPFIAPGPTRQLRMQPYTLPDFAIGEFPVTFREYTRFLDSLSPDERARRIAHIRGETKPQLEQHRDGWRLASHVVEGDARKRLAHAHELDLAVIGVSWFDALTYAQWLKTDAGVSFRLPTSLEWDKAARGVDGRPFPMGLRFDPCLAKVRESRPEASQQEPVGAFALDVSPYEVRDLTGGVHDWTATLVGGANAPDPADEHRESAQALQVLIRGGSWSQVHLDALIGRASYRLIDRTGWVGFRIAMDVAGKGSAVVVTSMRR
jgi:formylglycine-generating enzyme required for sulfatase activity